MNTYSHYNISVSFGLLRMQQLKKACAFNGS